MIQLGIVSDLSVQLPVDHVGVLGISRAKALAAKAAVATISTWPILSSKSQRKLAQCEALIGRSGVTNREEVQGDSVCL
jgi:hypothetical protein